MYIQIAFFTRCVSTDCEGGKKKKIIWESRQKGESDIGSPFPMLIRFIVYIHPFWLGCHQKRVWLYSRPWAWSSAPMTKIVFGCALGFLYIITPLPHTHTHTLNYIVFRSMRESITLYYVYVHSLCFRVPFVWLMKQSGQTFQHESPCRTRQSIRLFLLLFLLLLFFFNFVPKRKNLFDPTLELILRRSDFFWA